MKIFRCLAAFTALWLAAAAWADEAAVGVALDRFHQAAAHADSDAYLALLTPDAVFLGTDGSERWQGEAFRQFVLARFEAGEGWEYVPLSRSISLAADGNSAWFDETLRNDALGLCRGSGVLIRDGAAGWRVAQYNLSVPIPNALLPEVAAQIAAASGRAPVAAPPTGANRIAGDLTSEEVTTGPQAVSSVSGPAAGSAEARDPVEEASAASGRCARKRFKTNRKAGCD